MSDDSDFKTQAHADDSSGVHTLTNEDFAQGAPFAPLARSFYSVDSRLGITTSVPSKEELDDILDFRARFRVGTYPNPAIGEVVRSFRLVHGKDVYLEIGTFDRGNLAYVSTLLNSNAILIGVDVVDDPVRDKLLREVLRPGQQYFSVVGSSRSKESIEQVRQILGSRRLDALFIDGDHTAYGAMSDYANFEEFVDPAGVILMHDAVWEGSPTYKGVADALEAINSVDPVYLIDATNPPRKYCRPLFRDTMWGVMGVVFASDQRWRQNTFGAKQKI